MASPDERPGSESPPSLLGPRSVAGALVVVGALLIWSALGIAPGAGFSVIGPGAMPLVVAIGILVLALVLAARTTIVPDVDLAGRAGAEERAGHWPTVGLLGAALIIYAVGLNGAVIGPLGIPGLGYVVATGIFLPVAARILGSRRIVRDLLIGFGLAIVVYLGFTELLGVRLPPGLLGLVL